MSVELLQAKADLSNPCVGIVLERDYWRVAPHQLTRHIIYLKARGLYVHSRNICERKAAGSSVSRSSGDVVGLSNGSGTLERGSSVNKADELKR